MRACATYACIFPNIWCIIYENIYKEKYKKNERKRNMSAENLSSLEFINNEQWITCRKR